MKEQDWKDLVLVVTLIIVCLAFIAWCTKQGAGA